MAGERRGGRDAAAEHVRQASDGNSYTETEWDAWLRDAAAEVAAAAVSYTHLTLPTIYSV